LLAVWAELVAGIGQKPFIDARLVEYVIALQLSNLHTRSTRQTVQVGSPLINMLLAYRAVGKLEFINARLTSSATGVTVLLRGTPPDITLIPESLCILDRRRFRAIITHSTKIKTISTTDPHTTAIMIILSLLSPESPPPPPPPDDFFDSCMLPSSESSSSSSSDNPSSVSTSKYSVSSSTGILVLVVVLTVPDEVLGELVVSVSALSSGAGEVGTGAVPVSLLPTTG
jgi:hypothetical protein